MLGSQYALAEPGGKEPLWGSGRDPTGPMSGGLAPRVIKDYIL